MHEGKEDPKTSVFHHNSDTSKPRVSALALRIVPFGFYNAGLPSGLGQLYVEAGATFYQLSVVFNDLSLSECLYFGPGPGMDLEACPPDVRIRKDVVKTTAKVYPDFLVPDGHEEEDFDDAPVETRPQLPTMEASPTFLGTARGDPWTISFTWLEEELHDGECTDGGAFDEILEHLHDAIRDRYAGESPEMETL